MWNTSPNFPSNSTWILGSLTTRISPGVPLHQVSTIPIDSLRISRDFARWGSGIKDERKRYDIGVLRNTTLTFCLFLQTEGSSLDQLQRSSTMIDTSEEEGLIQVNEF